VFFEPTDIYKGIKPFQTSAIKGVTYASPNFNELKMMVAHIEGKDATISGNQLRNLAVCIHKEGSNLCKV